MSVPLPVVVAAPRPREPLLLCRSCGCPWTICRRTRRVAAAVERMGETVDRPACCEACARGVGGKHRPRIPRGLPGIGPRTRGRHARRTYARWQQAEPESGPVEPLLRPPMRE